MSVVTREQFEKLIGLRGFNKPAIHFNGNVNITINNFAADNTDEDFVDEDIQDSWDGQCDDCDTCLDYDSCWGEEVDEDVYEDTTFNDYADEDDYSCDCEYCRSQDGVFEDLYVNVDTDIETMEVIFDNGDWENAKEFIYEVIEDDYSIPSQKIVEFVNEYIDSTIKISTVAALRASWSRR